MDNDTEDMLNYLKHKVVQIEKQQKELMGMLGRIYEQNVNTQRILLDIQKKVKK